jgi:heparin/heparan-sulfate lyase
VNWLIRTIAHNCILVYQPGETWRNLRDGDRNPHANDGGQTNAWGWPVATLDDWNKRRDKFERAKLVAYDNQPGYMFVAGDCTKAYAPSKLSLCLRQIVFLRPSTTVIFDRVVSTRPDYHKTWLLHTKNEPKIEANRVTITAGKGRLISQTLLPENATIRKIFGYTYGGQTFPIQPSVLTPAAAKWRIEVTQSPTVQTAKEDLFLHVLFTGAEVPSPASGGGAGGEGTRESRVAVTVDARLIREGHDVGVRIGPTEVIFTGQVGGRIKVDGQQHTLEPQLKLSEYEK